MRLIRRSLLLAMAVSVLLSCTGKTALNRSKAEKLIQASDKFTPEKFGLPVADSALQTGIDQGLWHIGRGDGMGIFDLVLTEKGKTYFSSPEGTVGTVYRAGSGWSGNVHVNIAIPRHVTEVTGVTDASELEGSPGTSKVAEFQWKRDQDDFPSSVKPYLDDKYGKEKLKTGPFKGEAMLRLYDDGWRLEDVKLKE